VSIHLARYTGIPPMFVISDQNFIRNWIELFDAEDPRERDYVKTGESVRLFTANPRFYCLLVRKLTWLFRRIHTCLVGFQLQSYIECTASSCHTDRLSGKLYLKYFSDTYTRRAGKAKTRALCWSCRSFGSHNHFILM